MNNELINDKDEFSQILTLIHNARNRVYVKANSELIILYFDVGKIVSSKVSAGNWGDNTVKDLADFIKSEMPELTGFNLRGLYRMKQFYETYSNPQFVTTVLTQLQITESEAEKFVTTVLSQIQWTAHLHILNKTKTAEEKLYYLQLAIQDKLSVRDIERQLNASNFERTLLSNKIIPNINTSLPKNLFKDPYIFEFLNLPDNYSEKDFEKAIIQNLQKFILEVGNGFAYMGNQYRLQVGNKDYYTDLLFYHRDLQCLVLFELKIEEFEPEFLGKLNFYLEALDRNVKRENEKPSIGILLCKGKDSEVVEYAMARNTSPAIIAEYETKLINKHILTQKLQQLSEMLKRESE